MRSTKERVAAVRHRAEEIERQRQLRCNRVIGAFAAAVCLVIIAGLSFALPSLMADLPDGDYNYLGTAGSILDSRGAFGFIIIAFVSFVLGVSVTILCYSIHLKNKNNDENVED